MRRDEPLDSAGTGPPIRRQAARPTPGRDLFPQIVIAVTAGVVLGLAGLFFVLTHSPLPPPQVNTDLGIATFIIPLTGAATAGPTAEPAPRLALADFKALYDTPATRPLILDVRSQAAYDEGHIVDAISFPETDVDTRVGELPHNRLIVAYCQ